MKSAILYLTISVLLLTTNAKQFLGNQNEQDLAMALKSDKIEANDPISDPQLTDDKNQMNDQLVKPITEVLDIAEPEQITEENDKPENEERTKEDNKSEDEDEFEVEDEYQFEEEDQLQEENQPENVLMIGNRESIDDEYIKGLIYPEEINEQDFHITGSFQNIIFGDDYETNSENPAYNLANALKNELESMKLALKKLTSIQKQIIQGGVIYEAEFEYSENDNTKKGKVEMFKSLDLEELFLQRLEIDI